nr:acetylornithine transaminase [Caldalkalibacillus salinus]
MIHEAQKSQGLSSQSIMATYQRFPLTLVKGEGSYVWDDEGQSYLDFSAGIGTCNLGHVPPFVKEAVEVQLQSLWHCSNLYHIPQQEQLAKKLTAHTLFDQVFFCNSGAEANEAAIKLARKYGHTHKGSQATDIVTFQHSFHGRTMATLSATGQQKVKEGFDPLLPGFQTLPYNDEAALKEVKPEQTCAVFLEMVQGEGGVIPVDPSWLQALQAMCREHDILLIIDEIQTGMGRTGHLFAYEHVDLQPDVITVAKGLGSGFPIGALLAKDEVAQVFQPGSHGSTFGGNPVACAAGLATLETMLEPAFLPQVREKATYLHDRLNQWIQTESDRGRPYFKLRGLGLMLGIVVTPFENEQGQQVNATALIKYMRAQHILVLPAGTNVVRLLPPLTVTYDEIDQLIRGLEQWEGSET